MPGKNLEHPEDRKKLQLQHKLFAAVERMVKETRVFNVDLRQDARVSGIDPGISAETFPLSFDIAADITGIPVQMETPAREIVEELINPPIHDAGADELNAKITDIPTGIVTNAEIRNVPVKMAARVSVKDFFKEYNIKPRIKYTAPVNAIDLNRLKPVTRQIPTRITANIKENTYAIRRLTVEHAPVVLSFLDEKEQLFFWRKAVEKTRKEPRKLQLIGVYSSIAYDCIEGLKINVARRRLNYKFKGRIPRNRGQIRDIALFRDMDTDKSVMVRK